jgi:transposase
VLVETRGSRHIVTGFGAAGLTASLNALHQEQDRLPAHAQSALHGIAAIFVSQVLVPELRPGDVVIMDNLSRHERTAIRELIEAAGASLRYLPPYSPDFNPIEQAFARLKAMLRKAAERTVSGLWDRIAQLVEIFEPDECANYFSSCGYDQA